MLHCKCSKHSTFTCMSGMFCSLNSWHSQTLKNLQNENSNNEKKKDGKFPMKRKQDLRYKSTCTYLHDKKGLLIQCCANGNASFHLHTISTYSVIFTFLSKA